MTRFIPRDTARAEQLSSRLNSTIFKDVGTFVEYYNNGVINKNNDDTKETVRDIIETFKDVREKKGKLSFISENEVLVDEALADLSLWVTLTRVNREVSDAIDEGIVYEEGTLLLSLDGILSAVKVNEETGEEVLEPIGADKLKNNEIELLALHSTSDDTRDDGYVLLVRNILDLDGSFIKVVKEQIPSF